MNEYVIINKTAIQKRIEELEKDYDEKALANDDRWCTLIAGQIVAYKNILSQSTPLIPEIEKAFNASKKITTGMNQRNQFAYKYKKFTRLHLKLNI